MKELQRRQRAMEATLAKFRGRKLVWGSTDCMRVARYHLVEMGHSPPPLPRYRSLIGARRAADRVGGLEAVFDALLERVTPARMWLGDIAMLDGEGMESVVLFDGLKKMIGWHQDSDTITAMTAYQIKAAWRV